MMLTNPEIPRSEPPIEAPIYLSHEENSQVFDPVRQLYRQVSAASIPDAFNTEIRGVTLEGQPPAYLDHLSGYRKLGFSAVRNYGKETAVDIVLSARQPKDYLHFSSAPYEVNFAHNKTFTVREGTHTQPHGHMNFDDLAYLLGEYVPVSSFTELSDPRSAASFEEAAIMMSDGLEGLDRKRRDLSFADLRSFNSSEERFHGPDLDFITQRNAQLLATSTKAAGKGVIRKLAVELSAPLVVHDHSVNTILRYALDVPTNRRQPLKASAKLELRSATAARTDLEWALKSQQENIEPVRLILDAITMIRGDHTDKR